MTDRTDASSPGDAAYRALFALTTTPTVEIDPDGIVVDANNAAARLLQEHRAALVGTSLSEHLGAEALYVLATDAPVDIVPALEGGRVSLRLFSVPRQLDGDRTPNRIVQVTRREGRAARDAGLHGQTGRLTLIDDISHNLGTPLAIVAGYAETLNDRWDSLAPVDVRLATEAIRRHSIRAVDELRGIQSRVRALDGGSRTVPTNILVAWLRRMLAAPLAATGSVVVVGSVPAQITVDSAVARQALLSICQALLGAVDPADEIVIDATTTPDGTTLTITGRGVAGIRDEHRATVAVTASLVAEHGGTHDHDAEGARHVVTLPARGRTSPAPARIPVAIIEDDPDAAALIRTSLRVLGGVFEVVADERTLRTGLQAVAETRPRILLLDQDLPDGHGTQVLDRIHAVSEHTMIVVLSSGSLSELDGGVPARPGTRLHHLEKGRVMADLGAELLGILAQP